MLKPTILKMTVKLHNSSPSLFITKIIWLDSVAAEQIANWSQSPTMSYTKLVVTRAPEVRYIVSLDTNYNLDYRAVPSDCDTLDSNKTRS